MEGEAFSPRSTRPKKLSRRPARRTPVVLRDGEEVGEEEPVQRRRLWTESAGGKADSIGLVEAQEEVEVEEGQLSSDESFWPFANRCPTRGETKKRVRSSLTFLLESLRREFARWFDRCRIRIRERPGKSSRDPHRYKLVGSKRDVERRKENLREQIRYQSEIFADFRLVRSFRSVGTHLFSRRFTRFNRDEKSPMSCF